MPRNIPEGQPLSDEDRAWLQVRGQYARIATFDRNWPPADAPEPVDPESVPSNSNNGPVSHEGAVDVVNPVPNPITGDGTDSAGGDDEDALEIDEDIDAYVEGLENKDEVKIALDLLEDPSVEYDKDATRPVLNDTLAVALQERRNAGKDVDLGG
jgi:hypothetical protein